MTSRRLLIRSMTGLFAAAALLAASFAGTAASTVAVAPLSTSLVRQLATATGQQMPVLLHGRTLADAESALAATGMVRMATFRKVGVVAALATPAQITAARGEPGVTYLEGNQQLAYLTGTSHNATRGEPARTNLGLTGAGVSVAVVDSGVDPTHPSFTGGKVVRNLKSLCVDESNAATNCIIDAPTTLDTDTQSLGGHGTHVSGIAAGNRVQIAGGPVASGAASGAKIVSISTGAAILLIGADAALNWILENHRTPCGAGVPTTSCPPIKAVNNSYGPVGGGEFDPNSATVKIQRALAAEGVVTVWANGNDGGDGSEDLSNPAGKDPTGGIVSVASYFDGNTGTRDGRVSDFSSRGLATDPTTWPDISAPGEDITSSCRPYLVVCATGLAPQNGPGLLDIGTFNTISGTSMAAPHITGIVAQLFQFRPKATPAQIELAMKRSAYKYADGAPYVNGTSFDKGHGLVDVVAAADALATMAPL